jgi:hypothetical protein
MNAPSGIPSGSNFTQAMVDQTPRFERKKLFKKKLKAGRPSKKHKQQYWTK